ncbi:unnamed protein product [Orchesella dallaii]|uniref:Uncharacterized protein n=1 Tax=Orchesella dallaii TaxID=48710 RepID=A0ABP1QQM5_9HEXA
MGLGPWYRLGLSLGNCLILVAIIETALTFNSVCHGIATGMVEYMYGLHGEPPDNLGEELKEYPQYAFLFALYALQMLADVLLWLGIIWKVHRHILLFWVLITVSRTWMAAYLDIQEGWSSEFEGLVAINLILQFLWGTVVFLFKIVTGIQALVHVVCDDQGEKIHPCGQGIGPIRAFYMEHLKQLSVVLLISEIALNVHRSFKYSTTAFLMEAENQLGYEAPSEYGKDISMFTIVVNSVGLIFIAVNSINMRRSWIAAYVISILIHFCLFIYVVIDWTGATAHPQMFNGFVFVSLMHLIYKAIILYIYAKSIL